MSRSMNVRNHWQRLTASAGRSPVIFSIRLAYFASLAYVLVFWRAIWTPDLLFFMFLLLFVIYGQARQFIFNFGPFLLALLAYDSLRSIVPFLNKHVHYFEMINFDRWVGAGTLPTVRLQQLLYHGHLQWYDFYFYLLYMCHFLLPVVVAIIIWRWRRHYYARYVIAFLLLSYAGFVTYIFFPAAPPWMAAQHGYIPGIHKISTDIWWSIGVHNFPSLYEKLSPNPVAAVPSLHAAYPMLVLLFLYRAFSRRVALIFSIYPLSLWLGVVYMGEHYVFDVLLGVIYAALAFVASEQLARRYGVQAQHFRHRLGNHYRRHVVGTVSAHD